MPPSSARAVFPFAVDGPFLTKVAVLAVCYFCAAKASLLLAIPPGHATAVWPPSGIALAATLLYGLRVWPGIWIGAAVANYTVQPSLLLAGAIATGNTLEAVCGCWLIGRMAAPPLGSFLRLESVWRFAAAVAVSGTVSATPAVAALYLSGRADPDTILANWYTWWQGDANGMILLTPFLLAWLDPAERGMRRPLELTAFAGFLLVTLAALFGATGVISSDIARTLTFLLIPFIVWAGCRFNLRGLTAAILGVAGAAIWFTIQGRGPFLFSSRNASLLVLQAFTSTIALLGLVLCAFTRQRAGDMSALQKARNDLEATVRERTAELANKNRELAHDIADKERLAAILKNREGQLAEAQAIAHIGSWIWDVKTDHVSWSDELFRIYGLASEQFTASFEGYLSRVHPEDRPRLVEVIHEALARQQPWETTERIIRPDGTIRVLRSRGRVLTNEAGESTKLYGVCLDDTERIRLEQIQAIQLDVTKTLVHAGAWQDAVVRALGILCQKLGWTLGQMWRVDRQANVIRHACAWCQPETDARSFIQASTAMTFEPGRGLPGRSWQQRLPVWVEDVVIDSNFPRAAAASGADLHAAFALPLLTGGEVLGVIEFFHQQVRKPETEVLQMLMGLGTQLGEYIVRSESETLLKQSEERFRLLVEAVQEYAIFMLDPDGRVATWNAGAQRIKGYAAEEIIGQHFSRFYAPEEVAKDKPGSALRAAVAEGHVEDESWRVRKDGSAFWANVVITAVHDAAGRLRGFAKVTRDMTDRKRVEALEEAGRHTREFLAMLGHELRNPLAPIRNAVGILRAHDMADAEVQRCRDVIERQVEHLSRLVDDLLDAGRIASGKFELRREPVELATVLSRAVESIRLLIHARKHVLRVALPSQPVVVSGDSIRLSQIVQNLLNNAAKFTPEGGRIELTLQAEGSSAVIRVRDSGVGIAPDLLPRVFDLFVQGDRGLDRAEGGLGVGLTLVREITHLHGGSVQALSPGSGQGTEVVVRLPLLAVDAVPAKRSGDDIAPPIQEIPRRRVLVVDDNHDAADSMACLLQLWGHEARCAYDGPSALALAADYSPHVVLLDIGLPGMDGYEVGRRLRELPHMRDAVLIALTGYGQAGDRSRSASVGFDHHLVKPVDIETLRPLIDQTAS